MIQNEKQTDLNLNLDINKDIEENSPYQEENQYELYHTKLTPDGTE